jgi:hypothetical protein
MPLLAFKRFVADHYILHQYVLDSVHSFVGEMAFLYMLALSLLRIEVKLSFFHAYIGSKVINTKRSQYIARAPLELHFVAHKAHVLPAGLG